MHPLEPPKRRDFLISRGMLELPSDRSLFSSNADYRATVSLLRATLLKIPGFSTLDNNVRVCNAYATDTYRHVDGLVSRQTVREAMRETREL